MPVDLVQAIHGHPTALQNFKTFALVTRPALNLAFGTGEVMPAFAVGLIYLGSGCDHRAGMRAYFEELYWSAIITSIELEVIAFVADLTIVAAPEVAVFAHPAGALVAGFIPIFSRLKDGKPPHASDILFVASLISALFGIKVPELEQFKRVIDRFAEPAMQPTVNAASNAIVGKDAKRKKAKRDQEMATVNTDDVVDSLFSNIFSIVQYGGNKVPRLTEMFASCASLPTGYARMKCATIGSHWAAAGSPVDKQKIFAVCLRNSRIETLLPIARRYFGADFVPMKQLPGLPGNVRIPGTDPSSSSGSGAGLKLAIAFGLAKLTGFL